MPFVFSRCNDVECVKIPSIRAKFTTVLNTIRDVPESDDISCGSIAQGLASENVYVLSTDKTGIAQVGNIVVIELMFQNTYYTVELQKFGTGPFDRKATRISLSARPFSADRRSHSMPGQDIRLGGHRRHKPAEEGTDLLVSTLTDHYGKSPGDGGTDLLGSTSTDHYAKSPVLPGNA